jgi:hypothetical protein
MTPNTTHRKDDKMDSAYGVDTAAPLKYNAVGTPIVDPATRAADWTEACPVVIR